MKKEKFEKKDSVVKKGKPEKKEKHVLGISEKKKMGRVEKYMLDKQFVSAKVEIKNLCGKWFCFCLG